MMELERNTQVHPSIPSKLFRIEVTQSAKILFQTPKYEIIMVPSNF